MTKQEQDLLRKIIRTGVAEGVLLAGVLILLLHFVLGMLLSGL